ncbi:YqaJ viral recombinase family protein [Paraburkholderia sp. C35]|uniref:YqaJ viral recombinase family protein n=1 Tax=Paraburkholderia sp. C35 TaxID=2126993 RepID=UPI000D69F96A|nr:YqaJ viral recombinase family protein [Paraburkholderia sp. C35]
MHTHDLIQGSDEWMEFRLHHFGASEAAAMLGISKNVKRNELLHMKHTGTAKEYSDWFQEHVLDRGHELEALARPFAEEIIGDDLYPVTCSDDVLSASCDGLTLDEDTTWEHKQYNEALFASIKQRVLPEEHMPQAQQILMVTGARRLMFSCSDGTRDGMVSMWIKPDPTWFERLRAGWAQFEKDLASYEPRSIREKPQADVIMGLPTLAVQIEGKVVTSNLPRFKQAAESFIANIKTELKTDEDFANAEETVKFCEKAEKELEVAKSAAIAQTATIDDMMRTIDSIKEQLRRKRLDLDKLVKTRKEEIKTGIIADGRKLFADHVAALNAELNMVRLDVAAPDFISAAKNKRTLASLHEAIDTAVANGKIDADAAARELRSKLDWYRPKDEEYGFLFRDLQTVIQKPAEDFKLLVSTRIDQHKKVEAERLELAQRQRAEAAERAATTEDPGKAGGTAEAAATPTSTSAAPVAAAAGTGKPVPRGGSRRIVRPTAAQIAQLVANSYGVGEAVAAKWLIEINFEAELTNPPLSLA